MEIILKQLPKISLNKWYAGDHWTKRKAIKDNYKLIIRNQFKTVFPDLHKYIVSYEFGFKNNPLDASNCVAMLKMIEDIIFENDKYDIIKIGSIESLKAKEDYVKINVDIFKT